MSAFIEKWSQAANKSEILDLMKESGIDLQAIKHEQGMDDVDDFDFICHIAFGKKALTRRERAENVKKRDVFGKYGEEARMMLEQLLDKYMNDGIAELENPVVVLKNEPFKHIGTPYFIAVRYFGGQQQYLQAVQELKTLIYNVA